MLKRSLFVLWRSLRWISEAALLAGMTILFLVAVAVLALRYWVLPNVDDYRETIVQSFSAAVGAQVKVSAIRADWDGFRPQLVLDDLVVHDREGRPALRLQQTKAVLTWPALLLGNLRFHSIELVAPSLQVRRDRDGLIHVAGISLPDGEVPGELRPMAWLLAQRQVIVRHAQILWEDEMRGAPPLLLESVQLRLENFGTRHQFGLQARPPPELASPLEVRGDFRSGALTDVHAWTGTLYAEVQRVDLGAWNAWIPYPMALSRGIGGIRLWIDAGEGRLSEVTADVRLKDVKLRVEQDLPQLDLVALHGRLGWRHLANGFQFATAGLSLATRDGQILRPTDFGIRVSGNVEGAAGEGELRANGLDLGTLVALSGYLPMDATLRQRLTEFSPKGSVHDVIVKWTGEWPRPASYSAKGRFSNLALRPQGRIPGFSGVSGSIDGTEKGGTFSVSSRRAGLEMPLVFRQPLTLDTVTAQASWTRRGQDFEIQLSSVSFANDHLSGTVHGNYRGATGQAGSIDLTGSFNRVDARHVGDYVPLVISEESRAWIDRAVLAGGSQDVTLRLKGDLSEFPFPDSRNGLFEVKARVSGGTIFYAEGWPTIENISGSLLFRGQRMDVFVDQASILGTRLARVRADIPDLVGPEQTLTVEGQADGPTAEFLKFVEASPVDGYIDGITQGVKASGASRLSLKLHLPLQQTEKTRMTGSLRILGNRIEWGPDIPVAEEVNGTVEFTESDVKVQDARAIMAGGPATVNVTTQRDGTVRVGLAGRATAEGFGRASNLEVGKYFRGGTDWRASLALKKGQVRTPAELLLESSLQGLASDLPAPLAKKAGDALPLRLEWRPAGPEHYAAALSLGSLVTARAMVRTENGRAIIERGAASFGGSATLPDRNGVRVSGSVASLDLDAWRGLFTGTESTVGMELSAIDLKLGALDVFGRRFSRLEVGASRQGTLWQARLGGPEVVGDLQWNTQGKGKLSGQFQKFTIPAENPLKPPPAVAQKRDGDLPSMDLNVDEFLLRDKQLGRLELKAEQRERVWQIERLRIANPEAELQATGQWQGWASSPRTQMRLTLDLVDMGKLLGRLGYPNTMKWGNGKLEGNLGWVGDPYSLDYPTLEGTLKLQAFKGQFLKVEPGAGKLLGILSLQALPRRLLLDFRDVVDAGFEFDTITASAILSKGVAITRDFEMVGSSARVTMNGEVDLASESQNLRMRIVPALSEGVSLAGSVLGGPVVGAATLFVSKALKDPIGQIAAVEYNVTGSWQDPKVARVNAPAPTAE